MIIKKIPIAITVRPLNLPPYKPVTIQTVVSENEIDDYFKQCFINTDGENFLVMYDEDDLIVYRIESINDVILYGIPSSEIKKRISFLFNKNMTFHKGLFSI